ncbi:MAG: glycosyltransferase family 4 protein [Promethearchaeota archaeon]
MTKRRVCLALGSLYPYIRGGVEILFTNIFRIAMSSHKWDVEVLSRKPRTRKSLAINNPLPTSFLSTFRSSRLGRIFEYIYLSFLDQVLFSKKVASLTDSYLSKFDVIITPDPLITYHLSKRKKHPKIIQFASGAWAFTVSAIQPLLRPYAQRIERIAYKKADCTIFMDRIFLNQFKTNQGCFEIIPNGIDLSFFSRSRFNNKILRKKFLMEDKIVVITVATLRRRIKGLEFLIQSIPAVIEAYPNCHFYLVGKGNQGWLRDLAISLGILKNLYFLGERPDIPELLAASDMFVLPSLSEGTPAALLEAMAMELPSIATRVGGIPDIITHQKDGFLIKPEKQEEISSSIIQLLSHPELAKELGKNARNRIITQYSKEKTVEAYIALIERLCH